MRCHETMIRETRPCIRAPVMSTYAVVSIQAEIKCQIKKDMIVNMLLFDVLFAHEPQRRPRPLTSLISTDNTETPKKCNATYKYYCRYRHQSSKHGGDLLADISFVPCDWYPKNGRTFWTKQQIQMKYTENATKIPTKSHLNIVLHF